MTAQRFDLPMEQGVTFRRAYIWRAADGTPYNLTDATARMQARKALGQPAVFTLTEEDGLVLGGSEGTIRILVTDERTWLLTERRYKYDLYVYFPNGESKKVIFGNIPVTLAITQVAG